MTLRSLESGFTAVELLVSIMVGVLLISASYQLYSVALSSSGEAQRQTQASMAAYDLLRSRQPGITVPCSASTTTPAVPTTANLPGATATVVASCPYSTSSNVTLLTATVSYDSPNTKQVTRAISILP